MWRNDFCAYCVKTIFQKTTDITGSAQSAFNLRNIYFSDIFHQINIYFFDKVKFRIILFKIKSATDFDKFHLQVKLYFDTENKKERTINMGVSINADKQRRIITAKINGDLDHHTAKYIRGDIDMAIHENNPKTLILDFSAVTFMDSSGIGLVMGRYKIMNELSGEVLIANTPSYIGKVMHLAGLNKLCRIVTLTQDDVNQREVEPDEEKNC